MCTCNKCDRTQLSHLCPPPSPLTIVSRGILFLNDVLMYVSIRVHATNVTASQCSIFASPPSPLSHGHNRYLRLWNRYDSFHWKRYIPEIHQIEKLRFPSILQYKFKLRFWFDLNLYWENWISGSGRFWRCSIFSGICRSLTIDFTTNDCQNLLISRLWRVAACCSVLQRVAACCSV